MPVTRLNHAVLYVRDVELTREFYENVLGFKTLIWAPGQASRLGSRRTCCTYPRMRWSGAARTAGAPTLAARGEGH